MVPQVSLEAGADHGHAARSPRLATSKVPVTTCRMVSNTCYKQVPVTTCRMVAEPCVKKVCQTFCETAERSRV